MNIYLTVRLLTAGLTSLLLIACGTLKLNVPAKENGLPEAGWVKLGPDVWLTGDPEHPLVGMYIGSPHGMRWALENFVQPELARLRSVGEPTTPLEQARLQLFQRRFEVTQRFASYTSTFDVKPNYRSGCNPSASASAMNTTSQPGSKAYASARSCVTNAEVVVGGDSNWSFALDPNNDRREYYAGQPGQSVSGSIVKYHGPCSIALSSAFTSQEEGLYRDAGTGGCL